MQRKRLALLLALVLAGCEERAHLWEQPLEISGPYRVGSRAVWIDSTRGLALALDPAAHAPAVQQVRIPRGVAVALPAEDHEQLFVLTRGKEAIYKEQRAEEPALTVLQIRAGGELEVAQRYPLPAAFDRLAVAADRKSAIAFFGSSTASSAVFRNPNEVALLDLTSAAGTGNPLLRTIRSFGAAPTDIVFSPALTIPGTTSGARTLALLLAPNYLTMLDLAHRERREITVPLAKPEQSGAVTPREVLFSSLTSTIFVRAEGATDVFALALSAKAAQDAEDNDFTPTINQPSAGKQVQDMLLFSDGGQDLLLTANASQDLALIEAASSQAVVIELGEPVDTIVGVPPLQPTLALLYSQSQPTARIHFLALKDLAQNLGKNLTSRSLPQPVHQLVQTPQGQHALVVHDNQRTVVSVLDLVSPHHPIAPIQGTMALSSFDFVGESHLVGVSPTLPRLGALELSNLLVTEVRLDEPAEKVLALGEQLLVQHRAPEGLLTLVPGPTAAREDCQVLEGFLLGGLLEQELED